MCSVLLSSELRPSVYAVFSFNHNSHHCYSNTNPVWKPLPNDHVDSGCKTAAVPGCGAPAPPPQPPAPSPPPPGLHYDGVIRSDPDGSMVAYMIPPYKSVSGASQSLLPPLLRCSRCGVGRITRRLWSSSRTARWLQPGSLAKRKRRVGAPSSSRSFQLARRRGLRRRHSQSETISRIRTPSSSTTTQRAYCTCFTPRWANSFVPVARS